MQERLKIGACHTKLTRQISMTETNPGMQERSFSENSFPVQVRVSSPMENTGGKVGWLPQGSKLSDFLNRIFFCICILLFEYICYIII
jgi:hypothetical protein